MWSGLGSAEGETSSSHFQSLMSSDPPLASSDPALVKLYRGPSCTAHAHTRYHVILVKTVNLPRSNLSGVFSPAEGE